MRLLENRKVVTLLTAAAGASIVASVAALAAEAWWALELFTHFRLQYLAAQLLLIVILLLGRRPRWCFVLAACAVLNAIPLVPYVPIGSAAIADDVHERSDAMRIMAVNVQARNDSHERLLETVRTESPDVVVVVEFTEAWHARLQPLYATYPHRVLLPTRDAYGIALLSRFPLDEATSFELESTPAIDARVRSPQGVFRLIGVHLRAPTKSLYAAERNRQLDALAALSDSTDEPLVIVGDFNITPFSPFFADWLIDTELSDARSGAGIGFSWPTFLPILGIPIDHCIVSDEFSVIRMTRLPAFGSDHYPVLAELILETTS